MPLKTSVVDPHSFFADRYPGKNLSANIWVARSWIQIRIPKLDQDPGPGGKLNADSPGSEALL